jgi:DNA-directed RNA polymerase specialized sigma24 family protein
VPRTLADVEDIEQDLYCEVCNAFKKYNPKKSSPSSFCEIVLQRRTKNYLRDRLTQKNGRNVSQRRIAENEKNLPKEDGRLFSQQLDAQTVLRSLTLKNQIIATLMHNRGIRETSIFLNVPYSRLYTSVREIRKKISNALLNKEKNMISQPETLTAQQISTLPTNDLMQLADLINERLTEAKTMKERLEDGLHLRFSLALQQEMQSKSKDTGTVHFRDGKYRITAEVPKKIAWDSTKFEQILKVLPEVVKTAHSIDEKVYQSLSPQHKSLLDQARTVTPGKIRYKIVFEGDNQ